MIIGLQVHLVQEKFFVQNYLHFKFTCEGSSNGKENLTAQTVLGPKLFVKKWQFNIRTIFPLESIQLWQYIQLLQTESQKAELVPYL